MDNDQMTDAHKPEDRVKDLLAYFRTYDGAMIAYSGGVDSALLAYIAHMALGDGMLAVLADSPALPRREYRHAIDFVKQYNIPFRIVKTDEMDNPLFTANGGDRCYHCKKAMIAKLEALRSQQGAWHQWPICHGINIDDLGDYRPGIREGRT